MNVYERVCVCVFEYDSLLLCSLFSSTFVFVLVYSVVCVCNSFFSSQDNKTLLDQMKEMNSLSHTQHVCGGCERERECVCERERECVCVVERVCVCDVCVCVQDIK